MKKQVNEMTHFSEGDLLTLRPHTSAPGKGLTYPAQFVIACESGSCGGWDVYDGINTDAQEVSFYGFSITERTRARLAKQKVKQP